MKKINTTERYTDIHCSNNVKNTFPHSQVTHLPHEKRRWNVIRQYQWCKNINNDNTSIMIHINTSYQKWRIPQYQRFELIRKISNRIQNREVWDKNISFFFIFLQWSTIDFPFSIILTKTDEYEVPPKDSSRVPFPSPPHHSIISPQNPSQNPSPESFPESSPECM